MCNCALIVYTIIGTLSTVQFCAIIIYNIFAHSLSCAQDTVDFINMAIVSPIIRNSLKQTVPKNDCHQQWNAKLHFSDD